jgi:hypothetical protein
VLPPFAVIVRGYVPVLAVFDTVRLKCDVPEPGAAIEVGLKLPVTPDGKPVAESAIAELNPPETVVVTTAYPLWPCASEPAAGETETVKVAATGAVIVSETTVLSIVLPLVPVTVMGYVPVGALEATVKVNVEVPVPVIDPALKPADTPDGSVDVDSPTGKLKPPLTVLVIVEVPELPSTTETEAGEAETLKPGVATVPANALIRPLPFGLPHPVARSYPVVAE